MQIGLGLWLGTRQVGGFNPAAVLFGAGEQGGWYDPSDISTLFQDTAGTTPVTATGQTVARINDKSGRGNHLTQATAASRPIYGIEPFGGRRNLLTFTEQFDNAAWLKLNGVVTANDTTAPDGTATADTFSDETATNVHGVRLSANPALSTTYAVSVYAKMGTRRYVSLSVSAASSAALYASVSFDLQSGAVVNTGAVGTGFSVVSSAIENAGNGWYRCIAVLAFGSAGTLPQAYISTGTDGSIGGFGLQNYTGTNGTVFLWGAQLELGSLATPYQRVTDQWNVTEAGVPSVSYLQYDGTDDWFISPTITPGIDKAQVFAGVRKLSDAAAGIVVESGTGTENGIFVITAPRTGGVGNYRFISKGTVLADAFPASGYSAPITNVLTGIGDIAADTAILRVNGTQVATSAADQGTGNYLAYPLYVGRRGGTTLPFNGRLYQLLVRYGANLDAATIAATETFVNSKTGAY